MGSKKDNSKKGKASENASTVAGNESIRGNGFEKKTISDSRFARVHTDPRFREPPQKKSKVIIDSRFNRMFTDKNFSSSKAPTDIRGRPVKSTSKTPFNHYYHLEEEVKEKVEKSKKQEKKLKLVEPESEEEEEESESDSGRSKGKNEDIKDRKLKKVGVDSSESEGEEAENDDSLSSSEDSDTDSDSSDEMDEASEEEDTFLQKEDVPEIDKETRRLAVVNMDWGRVKAVDLYMLLSSFLPKGGQIISVAVYPSDFGLKRMEEEALHGPVGLFDDENGKNEDSDDDDDDEIDNDKLRAYELSRLRYYYAVVESDSSATADYLYKTCDGVEFERTSNKLDLRFIPDSLEFKHQPRDIATEAPTDYEGLDFHTRALQQSNIELTWDEDEPQRVRTLKRKFNADQLADLELKEFLASDESETEDSEEGDDDTEDKSAKKKKKQDMYRSLLQPGEGSDEDDNQDLEVTFNTGLEDLSKRLLEKKDKQSETVWEAVLRKKRDKKKARKGGKSKDSSEDESSDSDQEPVEEVEDFFEEEEPPAKGIKKAKQNLEASEEEAEASRAELELLLADDKGGDANLKGYNMKFKKSKGKKGKEIPDEGKLPSVDYGDPRFQNLFQSPLFALDPTDPQFKRSAAYVRQLAQKQHKAEEEIVKEKQQPELKPSSTIEAVTSEKFQSDDLPSRKEKHELSSLVKSIKMKSKQMSLPSQGKVVVKKDKSRTMGKK